MNVTVQRRSVVGDLALVIFSADFDSSYASGGEEPSGGWKNALGTSQIYFLTASPKSGLIFEFDYSAVLLKAIFPTGGAGTPAAALAVPTGLAATGAVTASAVDATRPTVAILPGVGKEVPASQNLSTLTGVRGYAYVG